MPRGQAIPFSSQVAPGAQDQVTRPSSIVSKWLTVVQAGGVDDNDNSGNRIVTPESQIASATTIPVLMRSGGKRPDLGGGTYVRLRLAYDDALTVGTDVIIQVFGRTGSEAWECLPNMDGDDEVALTADETNDVRDTTHKYTSVDRTGHVWDTVAHDEIIVGIRTALADGGGVVNNAFIQLKIM